MPRCEAVAPDSTRFSFANPPPGAPKRNFRPPLNPSSRAHRVAPRMTARPARCAPILALLLLVAPGLLCGCASVLPLELTNQSAVPVTAELIAFQEGEAPSHDWDSLLDGVPPLEPGRSLNWKRRTRGVTYLLAIAGPGLDGPRGYALLVVPAAPATLIIRGDAQRIGVWVRGDPPILLRP